MVSEKQPSLLLGDGISETFETDLGVSNFRLSAEERHDGILETFSFFFLSLSLSLSQCKLLDYIVSYWIVIFKRGRTELRAERTKRYG